VNTADLKAKPDPHFVVVRIADVESTKVDWLWKPRIARGKLIIFAGMPDVNKSTLLLDVAARVTVGGPLPAGEGKMPQGSVVLLTAEDDLADTVRPRLEVAGADLSRVHVIQMVREIGQQPARSRCFDLTQDIERLELLIDQIGDVVLVGIDPVSAYMGKPGKLDSHRNSDIRATLMPLHEMAARKGVAIIGIDHLNKSSGTQAMLRVVGSIALVGAPRSVYLIVRDEDDEERRLFLPVKNNLAKIRTGLAFKVIEKLAPAPVFEMYPAISWEPQPVMKTADEALAIKPDGRASEAMQQAKSLLEEMIGWGPCKQRDIEQRAAAKGISEKSLRNAKKALYVRSERASGHWWWLLPGQELSD
jgi:putative DNA primase/helicase